MKEMLDPIIPLLVHHHRPHLSHRVPYMLRNNITYRMIRTRGQLPNPHHVANSAGELGIELAAIFRLQRLWTTSCRDIVVDENVSSSGAGNLQCRHRVHRGAATETVRNKQNILLVPAARDWQRAKIIERDCLTRLSGRGIMITGQRTVLRGHLRA